jgi:hypothetical protein
MYCKTHIVVFDLDETLGYFLEFGMFWDALKEYIKYKKINTGVLDQELFDNTLDLYPEFSRPNIINILQFLKQKKKEQKCDKIMIYTNNQGPNDWAIKIKNYFENKIDYRLFDQIIGAFKVNGQHVEICRTTHMKTHKDFVKCSKIPDNAQICFLDDTYYPGMSGKNIYYINIKPYIYDLYFEDIISRFSNSEIINKLNIDIHELTSMKEFMLDFMKRYNYNYVEKSKHGQEIDIILSKKILHHLHIFFNKKNNQGTKRRKNIKNKTLKNGKKHLL